MDKPKVLQKITQFTKALREHVDKQVKNAKFDRHVQAVVVNVGTYTADIQLSNHTYDSNKPVIPNVPNKSGETLVSGDEVYLLCINGSLSNSIIHIRKRLS